MDLLHFAFNFYELFHYSQVWKKNVFFFFCRFFIVQLKIVRKYGNDRKTDIYHQHGEPKHFWKD